MFDPKWSTVKAVFFVVAWNIKFFKNERKLSLQSCVTSSWPLASIPAPLRRSLSPKSQKIKAALPVMKVMRTKMRSGPCTACSNSVTTWCATLLKVVHWTSADCPATVSIFNMKEITHDDRVIRTSLGFLWKKLILLFCNDAFNWSHDSNVG